MSINAGNLPAPVQLKFNGKILATPQARLIYGMCAIPYTMEANSGDILRMRRYTRIATAPVPLGVAMNNPPPQLQPIVDIDAKIDWYATYSVITKQVTLINQDPQTFKNGIYKLPLIDLETYVEQEAA